MIQKSLEFNFSVTNKRHVKIKYATNSKPCGIPKSCTYWSLFPQYFNGTAINKRSI